MQNRVYSFVPSASDPDGDTLTFRVENAPGWLTFDESTGKISGLPQMQHVGTHADIALFVSDGELETALDPFAIEVLLSADGSLTLNWTPPTTSADGSALLDLAGYRVRWGSQPGDHPNFEQIDNPGIATIVIGDLLPGTYYFVITAFDTSNNESAASNEASGTVL